MTADATRRPQEVREGGAINAWDVIAAMRAAGLRGPVVWPGGYQEKNWSCKTRGLEGGWRKWAEVVEAFPQVTRWATLGATGHAPWFSLDHGGEAALAAVKMAPGRRRPKLYAGRPCESYVSGEISVSICGRPVDENATTKVRNIGVEDGAGCKMHVAAQARSDASMAAHRARWDADDERRRKRDDLRTASEEWAERFRSELGIAAEGTAADGEHLRIAVEPERLYGQLVELLAELRDLEVPHPFHPAEETPRCD